MSDSPELLKPNAEVTESELQIEIGNSKAENETLRADYAKLLESSTHVTNKLQQEVQELRSQLETERASWEGNKKSVAAEKDLPEAADLLNKLKVKRKKSKTDLADLEVILELLEG